jgi:hypothetical protein
VSHNAVRKRNLPCRGRSSSRNEQILIVK